MEVGAKSNMGEGLEAVPMLMLIGYLEMLREGCGGNFVVVLICIRFSKTLRIGNLYIVCAKINISFLISKTISSLAPPAHSPTA